MSCPDWRALCHRRETGPGDGPGWRAALRHLDGCPECQVAAPAADPILLFRRLPALEAGSEEVAAMKLAVAGMRRGESIERRPARRWTALRAAALAAVLLGTVLLRGAGQPPPEDAEAPPVASATAELDLEWLPLVETTDPSYGSIIQVVDDDISLVVVLTSDAELEKGTDVDVAYPDA